MNKQTIKIKALLLAGLLASSVLFMPALADAATEDTISAQAAPAPDSSPTTATGANPQSSPYAKVNRQRAQAAAEGHARSMNRALRQLPTKPARGKRQ